jgi:type II secretory pathway component PulK
MRLETLQGVSKAGTPRRRDGFVLIAVLVVITLLALAAYQYSELMTSEYNAVETASRATQARALANSGVHYAAALLSDPNSLAGTLNGNPYNSPGAFQDQLVAPSDTPRFQGRFSVVAPLGVDEGQQTPGYRYGVTDEAGKLNLNTLVALDPTGKVAHDMLILLPNMTEEIADAIIDWIDADENPRPNGAESDYYSGLSPSYQCKNGPLDSLEELLFVRGVTPQLLFGNDLNRNGTLDADEADGGTGHDRGWSAYLTVYSRERNVDADGNARIYLNDPDVQGLYNKLNNALGADLANYVVAYRLYGPYTAQAGGARAVSGGKLSQNNLDFKRQPQSIPSLFGLINTQVGITSGGSGGGGGGGMTMTVTVTKGPSGTVVATQGTGSGGSQQQSTTRTYACPLNDATQRATLLPLLLDKCTTQKATELPARVNVNTAPQAVLAALPGLQDTDVETILNTRPSPVSSDAPDQAFQTVAWLMTEANLPAKTLQTLERYVTARTSVYRVQSVGYFDGGGPTARVEAVIDTNGGNPRIVYWRDLSELNKGFDLQNQQ